MKYNICCSLHRRGMFKCHGLAAGVAVFGPCAKRVMNGFVGQNNSECSSRRRQQGRNIPVFLRLV